ncbi:MAG: glycosyltransferase [Bacteroidota bacterium]
MNAPHPPMISIVIPTLNEERLLERMLGQFPPLLRRTENVEIVVSDGGSRDRTLEIARRHGCLVVERRDGEKENISTGRNRGARRSRGDLLVFLNADTLLENAPAFLERVRAEASRPGVAAVTCGVRVYPWEEGPSDRRFHSFTNWLFRLMNTVGMGMGRGECHVMLRSTFERVRGYAVGIAAGEDYDMFRRLRRLGKVSFLGDVTVYESPRRYRRYGYGLVSASWLLNFLAVFLLRRSILDEWKPVR